MVILKCDLYILFPDRLEEGAKELDDDNIIVMLYEKINHSPSLFKDKMIFLLPKYETKLHLVKSI